MDIGSREVFVRNITMLMSERRIRQVDIAKALSASTTTVSDWVNGKKYPRIDTMQKLADFFEVSMKELTTERGDETIEARTFTRYFQQLNEDQKRFVIQSMKGLLREQS